MPDIGKMMRDEISRLARKEVRSQTQTLGRQVRDLKKLVSEQKKTIARLQKTLDALSRKIDDATPAPTEPDRDIRITPASIKKHRTRLGLSQEALGALLGVSTVTVGNWETGKTKPQGQNRQAIAEIRQMGVREAQARLSS